METPFVSTNPRTSSRAKTLAIVALAVVGTFAACFVVFNGSSDSTLLSHKRVHVNPTALHDLYTHWKMSHNKTYGGAEDALRFNVFANNYQTILSHNAKGASYKLGLNRFADLTQEEFSSVYLGYNAHHKPALQARKTVKLSTVGLPDEVDWTGKAVTDVKDQGQCGSCWAFSTTGALEGLQAITNGKILSFSEQQLVDCAGSYGNLGCNGGLMDYGFAYVRDNGIGLEENYPYKAVDGTCKKVDSAFQNKAFADVEANSDAQLQAAVANGPVSVAIEADTYAFQLYAGGVLDGDACGTQLDHGVLAVGYGVSDGKGYWKVKNSWGGAWGEKGHILIGRADGKGVCGINQDASYPTL